MLGFGGDKKKLKRDASRYEPLSHSWFKPHVFGGYIHEDRDADWHTFLIVGERGGGKGVICQRLIWDGLFIGRQFWVTTPLKDEAKDFEFIAIVNGKKEKRKVGDWVHYISPNAPITEFQKLTDGWLVDQEMWKNYASDDVSVKKGLKTKQRRIFNIARHNRLSIVMAGQDEVQISYEFRKDFNDILFVRKLSPRKLFYFIPWNPLGVEVVLLDKSTCFNSSNRLNLDKYKDQWVIYPQRDQCDLFDTHAERHDSQGPPPPSAAEGRSGAPSAPLFDDKV